MFNKKFKLAHIKEIIIYAIVGFSALGVQTAIYLLLANAGTVALFATIAGNCGGMVVSYFGHTIFTFKKNHKFSRKEFIKFMLTNFAGLALNSLFVVLMVDIMRLHYAYVVYPQALITPWVTFLISKFWAFK